MRAPVFFSVFCLLVAVTTAELLRKVSFGKPFDTVSHDGDRLVGDNWSHGGSTIVNRHFVRLTPDRQSRKGYIWSKTPIGQRDFSLILTFRISGQAQSWYGDGLALWITKTPDYLEGDNHGFIGDFRGVGLVFDTFVNSDHPGGHKDVTVFENNGTRTLDDLNYMQKVGCDAPGIRYHEKNAAFSPSLNMSRVKLQVQNNYLWVSVDAANKGEWTPCYQAPLTIPSDWFEESHIGITASTGGLADNHDVISLDVFTEVVDSIMDESDDKVKNAKNDLDESLNNGDDDARVKLLKAKFLHLVEDFEYQFAALKESTQNTIKKLQEREAKDTSHIQQLEQYIGGKISEGVQKQYHDIHDSMDETLKKSVAESAKKSSGWKMPFFVLLLLLGAIFGFGYKKYLDLRKAHIL